MKILKNYTKYLLAIIGFLTTQNLLNAQSFSVGQNTKVNVNDALFFDGTKGIDFQFGQRISPHGACIDVAKDPATNVYYIFVAWWKGGTPTNRKLMVSRKRLGGGEGMWQTIQLPDTHFGFQGNPNKGDSHNIATICVCPTDGTVHLMYDMHSYTDAQRPGKSFLYRNTDRGGAFAANWDSGTFNTNKNVLKAGTSTTGTMLEDVTYPDLERDDVSGKIYLSYRNGGSGSGFDYYAVYTATATTQTWTAPILFSSNVITGDTRKYSIYGGIKVLNGQLKYGFSIRYNDFDDLPAKKYSLNFGIYYTSLDDAANRWEKADGSNAFAQSGYLTNPNIIKVSDIIDPNGANGQKMNSGPTYTVTTDNSVHMLIEKDGVKYHYYRSGTSSSSSFVKATVNVPEGDLFTISNKVCVLGLENGFPVIYSTTKGTSNFVKVYTYAPANGEKDFLHGNVVKVSDTKVLFFYMKDDDGAADSKRPIHLLELNVTPAAARIAASDITVEPSPIDIKLSITITVNDDESVIELQKSANGKDFVTLQQFEKSYQGSITTIDNNPLTGNNHYRLVQTLSGGQVNVLSEKVVNYEGDLKEDIVYPNPTKEEINFRYYVNEDGIINTSIVGMNGRAFQNDQLQTQKSRSLYKIKLNQTLPTGTYLFVVKGTNKQKTYRVVVE